MRSFITGASLELNNKTMGFGMMFMHELLHTKVGLGVAHGCELNSFGSIGRIVNAVNAIRGQLGSDYGQRLSSVSYEYNGKIHLPFDKSNLQLTSAMLRGTIKHGSLTPKISPSIGKYISY